MTAVRQPTGKAHLRQALESFFDLAELKNLAFDLDVDYQLFAHETKADFARELIAYFDRRNQLRCLVLEILRRRQVDDLHQLLDTLPECRPSKKVQIIVAPDLLEDVSGLLGSFAAELGLATNEIGLIGAAWGSTRLLLGLSQEAAGKLSGARIRSLIDEDTSLVEFDSLDLLDQVAWRVVVLHWPPVHEDNRLRPTISWDKALEMTTTVVSALSGIPSGLSPSRIRIIRHFYDIVQPGTGGAKTRRATRDVFIPRSPINKSEEILGVEGEKGEKALRRSLRHDFVTHLRHADITPEHIEVEKGEKVLIDFYLPSAKKRESTMLEWLAGKLN